jgi:hypothetical protein
MKKAMILVAAVTVFAGAVAAQQKVSISLDVAPLFKGAVWWDNEAGNSLLAFVPAFEYRSHPRFTIGASADLYSGKASDTSFFYGGLAVHGRGYPVSTKLDQFFLDVGLGFNVFSFDGETDPKKGGFFGPTFSIGIGYKLMVTPKFFVEPSMSYVYAKIPGVVYVPTPTGWQPGLSAGIVF